jgi:hypothetical protein
MPGTESEVRYFIAHGMEVSDKLNAYPKQLQLKMVLVITISSLYRLFTLSNIKLLPWFRCSCEFPFMHHQSIPGALIG